MRIAVFTNNYLPNPYGVTGSIESFRRELEVLGHQVFVFAPFYKDYQDNNPNVFRYPSIDIEFKFKFPLAVPYSKKIDKILEKLDPDVIHAQHPNLLGTAARKWAKKKKIPLIFTWHTLYDRYAHFAKIIPQKIAGKWIIKKAVKYANACDQIIIPTESVRPIIRKWGVINPDITAIPTGVEESVFANPDKNIVRKKYHISEDEILLLLISRLTEEKNISFLFEAVAPILKNDAKTKFLVAGDGYLVPELKKMARRKNLEKRIIFAGIIPRVELKNYFSAGDIFVYASKSETQGMAVSEAMYMGLPIVAVEAPGVSSLVENNISGLLVCEDNKEFQKSVGKLIDNSELRKKMGAESARVAREKYTGKVCAQKMLAVYEKAIREKSLRRNS